MRLLKYKMLYIYQRPTPKNARSLGSFNYFIKFIGTFSIIVNSIVFSITLMGFEPVDDMTNYQTKGTAQSILTLSRNLQQFDQSLRSRDFGDFGALQ